MFFFSFGLCYFGWCLAFFIFESWVAYVVVSSVRLIFCTYFQRFNKFRSFLPRKKTLSTYIYGCLWPAFGDLGFFFKSKNRCQYFWIITKNKPPLRSVKSLLWNQTLALFELDSLIIFIFLEGYISFLCNHICKTLNNYCFLF